MRFAAARAGRFERWLLGLLLGTTGIEFGCGSREPSDHGYVHTLSYDDSTIHTTDWAATRIGDVDRDGCEDLGVFSVFDPQTRVCRESMWLLSGRTGMALARVRIDSEADPCANGLASIGGCCDFAVEPIGDLDGDEGPGLAVLWVGHSNFRGAVFLVSARARESRRVLAGGAEGEDFGWSFSKVGDLDSDGVQDYVGSSRGYGHRGAVARAFSGASGAELWSTEGRMGLGFGAFEYIDSICGMADIDGGGAPEVALGVPGARRWRGAVLLVAGEDGSLLGSIEGTEPSTGFIGDPLDSVGDWDGDGDDDLLVGARSLPSRVLDVVEWEWLALPRPLFRARPAGDVDGDGVMDFIGAEIPYWDPEEVVVASGADGNILWRFGPEPGYRMVTGWTVVGDQDGDGRSDFAVVSDRELTSGWGTYNWSPDFGAVTVYSGSDGSVLRRVTREVLLSHARSDVPDWVVK